MQAKNFVCRNDVQAIDFLRKGSYAPDNIVSVCKSHYIHCFINELGIASTFGNPTLLTKGDSRLDKSVLCSFGIATIDGELDLSSLY